MENQKDLPQNENANNEQPITTQQKADSNQAKFKQFAQEETLLEYMERKLKQEIPDLQSKANQAEFSLIKRSNLWHKHDKFPDITEENFIEPKKVVYEMLWKIKKPICDDEMIVFTKLIRLENKKNEDNLTDKEEQMPNGEIDLKKQQQQTNNPKKNNCIHNSKKLK